MATARDILTKDDPDRPATTTIMGGPGGTLSTADLVRAKQAYDKYVGDTGTEMSFEQYVHKVWKPSKANGDS